jgi:3' terminal RNA ribose 2'-O-methyltransferase Hen1
MTGTIGHVLLTITTTREPATDLGYLLHKHPGRVQSFGMSSGGTAHVFYPAATDAECTAALLLEVDPVGLVRGPGDGITHYVNDRPYAASSLLAVALKDVFRTALTGRCDARPELAASAIPLEIRVPSLPCRGGAELARRLFGPLGWHVAAQARLLDPPDWGESPYVALRLTGEVRLADALNHLYVLLPVLDDAKHYWVSTDEVDKLVRAGGGWLAAHPEKELIARRYLAHRRSLANSALARLAEADDLDPGEIDNAVPDETAAGETAETECVREPAPSLSEQRHEAVLAVLRESGAKSVGDFGCGAGALTERLVNDPAFERIIATDVSARALELAARRLRLDRMPEARKDRLSLFQSALTYRDDRLAGLDAAVLMEVVEHVDPERLPAFARVVFGFAAPRTVVVTTPNAEYNHVYGLADGTMRHHDHRFEWSRPEFATWARTAASAYGYDVRFLPVGPDSDAGSPTQLAVFAKRPGNEGAR